MSDKSKISWCEATWNCICGCSKVSDGCKHCFAERMAKRLKYMFPAGMDKYGRAVDKNGWTGEIYLDQHALEIPLHWKKPRMIFVNSMSDTFHPKVPFEFIKRMWDVSAKCPQHTFQYLTKRPEQALRFSQWMAGRDDISIAEWPRNCHFGWTAENQPMLDLRTPQGLRVPAAVRFISAEPLLGELDFTGSATNAFCEACTGPHDCNWEGDESELLPLPKSLEDTDFAGLCPKCKSEASYGPSSSKTLLDGIDQVIIGAESIGGNPGRECKIEWVRNIVRQCKAAGVAVFVKQIHMWKGYSVSYQGAVYSEVNTGVCQKRVLVKDITKFPEDLQIREYPKGR